MTKEEILQLASLARIRLTDREADEFRTEVDSILHYVEAVRKIASDEAVQAVPPVHNVMREDRGLGTPGEYTEALLDAAPERVGRYVRVKKILGEE